MVKWAATMYLSAAAAAAALIAIDNTSYAEIVPFMEAGRQKWLLINAQAGMPSAMNAVIDNVVMNSDIDKINGNTVDVSSGNKGTGTLRVAIATDDINTLAMKNALVSGMYTIKTATIANGQSLSGEVDLEGYTIAAISMPAAWTTAVMTFKVATATGGTFYPLFDDAGNEVSSAAAAAQVYGQDINSLKVAGCRFVKIQSGTNASAVAQGAERIITLLLKG